MVYFPNVKQFTVIWPGTPAKFNVSKWNSEIIEQYIWYVMSLRRESRILTDIYQFNFFIDQFRSLKGQQENCHNISRVWTFQWWTLNAYPLNYFDNIEINISNNHNLLPCSNSFLIFFFFKSHLKHWKVLINVFMHVASDANSYTWL